MRQYFKNPWAKYFHYQYLKKRVEPHCPTPKAVVPNRGYASQGGRQ